MLRRLRSFRPMSVVWFSAFAIAAASLVATSSGAAADACRVRDVERGSVYSILQHAVDDASPGDHLRVTGTCHGTTRINVRLELVGLGNATAGLPVLDGDGLRRVVVIGTGAKVTITGLTIRHGAAGEDTGGAIVNRGTLVLRDVAVRGSTASAGGGIESDGMLVLRGSTVIRGNRAGAHGSGGGIAAFGTLVMRDSSSVHGNRAGGGGGVAIMHGTLVMRDHSTIHDNTAVRSGLQPGGGVSSLESTLVGVHCGHNGNVYDNSPTDCSSGQ